MTEKQKEQIKDFILNNHLSFAEGYRNADSCVLAGYCLHIELRAKDVYDILVLIDQTLDTTDDDRDDEFSNVLSYAEKNDYGREWDKRYKDTYKF